MMVFKKNKAKPKPNLNPLFDYEPQQLEIGKETLHEMSLIQAQYYDFLVTKTGYLVCLLKGTGINLDLLNASEQEDVFNEFNAFLMSTLEEADVHQYLDMTIPVAFDDYVLFWKKRYLHVLEEEPTNVAKITLIASYVDYYQTLQSTNEMSTKVHVIVLREKLTDKTKTSLELAAAHLTEKSQHFIRELESSLESYDMEVTRLNAHDIRGILKHLFNFSQH
ncbi:TrsD/TraD family conjugative transfer protein [Jeotgalibaca caeni]|uniref:TrsD/TraD family conjugative transfer protein n=1 Tax=Jeotgalibaca caeni TaxID=3028623 RepID=UPI00237DEF89|nr:TrsD/TraD family conjugative transfer protein [Jeotgalibaca caeni]MDE1548534.1 TrsD/TraD family conjugative transfer protein [Jeotgalibaca caeni]